MLSEVKVKTAWDNLRILYPVSSQLKDFWNIKARQVRGVKLRNNGVMQILILTGHVSNRFNILQKLSNVK